MKTVTRNGVPNVVFVWKNNSADRNEPRHRIANVERRPSTLPSSAPAMVPMMAPSPEKICVMARAEMRAELTSASDRFAAIAASLAMSFAHEGAR